MLDDLREDPLITTSAEFTAWLRTAAHGERVTYYTGELGRDRDLDAKVPTELHLLANAVLEASERGEVAPLQRRLGEKRFEYFVVKGQFKKATPRADGA